MSGFQEVANQFVPFYYNQFDQDRKQLAPLYRDASMLTFESTAVLGAANIVEKLAALPFQKVQHEVATIDAQPAPNDGVFVLVTGKLLVDEEQRPMSYTQAFQLLPENGSYYVYNDVFKLIYG